MNCKLIAVGIVLAVACGLGLFFHYWSKDDRRQVRAVLPTGPDEPTVRQPAGASDSQAEAEAALPQPSPVVEPDEPDPAADAAPGTPAAWVAELGASSFATRRKAEAALLDLGAKALPALGRAAASADPELRARARRLRRQIYLNRWMTSGKVRTGVAGENEGDKEWPFELVITKYTPDENSFTGKITWKTLDSIHTVEGTVNQELVSFRETAALQEGKAILDCVYTFDLGKTADADFSGSLTGSWQGPKAKRGGPVSLDLHLEP